MHKPPSLRPQTDLSGYVVDKYGKLRAAPQNDTPAFGFKDIPFKRITEWALAVGFGYVAFYMYSNYLHVRSYYAPLPHIFFPPGIMAALLCVFFACGAVSSSLAWLFCLGFAADAWYLHEYRNPSGVSITGGISFGLALLAYFMYGRPRYEAPAQPGPQDIEHFRETQPYGSAGLATAAQIDRALRGEGGTGGNASAGMGGGGNAEPQKFWD